MKLNICVYLLAALAVSHGLECVYVDQSTDEVIEVFECAKVLKDKDMSQVHYHYVHGPDEQAEAIPIIKGKLVTEVVHCIRNPPTGAGWVKCYYHSGVDSSGHIVLEQELRPVESKLEKARKEACRKGDTFCYFYIRFSRRRVSRGVFS